LPSFGIPPVALMSVAHANSSADSLRSVGASESTTCIPVPSLPPRPHQSRSHLCMPNFSPSGTCTERKGEKRKNIYIAPFTTQA